MGGCWGKVSGNLQCSLTPFPVVIEAIGEHNLGPCFQLIFGWARDLHAGDNMQTMWLSSSQLLIHFQSTTGMIGVLYDRPNRLAPGRHICSGERF